MHRRNGRSAARRSNGGPPRPTSGSAVDRRHRRAEPATGIAFLDHMLDQIARHGMIDLAIEAKGDLHIDAHHTVEDVGITLGQAFKGDRRQEGHPPLRPRLRAARRGAVARGDRLLRPSGPGVPRAVHARADRHVRRRPDPRVLPGLRQPRAGTLHIDNLRGDNAHHQCETVFKAFARALRMACELDPRAAGAIPSTKGTL